MKFFLVAVLYAALASAAFVRIHPNGNNNKCVGVVPNVHQHLRGVTIQTCNSSNPDQQWNINCGATYVYGGIGSIKFGDNPSYCMTGGEGLTHTWTGGGNGNGISFQYCAQGDIGQSWWYTDDDRIAIEGKGFCLDLTNGDLTDGNMLQLWQCSTGNTNQIWTTTKV